MDLRVEKVSRSKRKNEIKNIYTSSFDKKDRMPFFMMIAMSFLWNTEFFAFYDGDILCGFIYMATIHRMSFVMFFAVDEKLRSKGYGSSILKIIQMMYPKNKIIITIEPCDADVEDVELRIRRKNFYMRNGYKETGYFIKLGKEQEIIINNGVFKRWQFSIFLLFYCCLAIIPRIRKKELNISKMRT